MPCKYNWQKCSPVKLLASSPELHWQYFSWICSAQLITPSLSAGDAMLVPIYSVSRTIVAPSLIIWPVQITQSYGGYCPANTVDCIKLQILLAQTYYQLFLANPTNKFDHQCSEAPCLWLEAPLHWLTYLSVGFAWHRRLYRPCDRICNVCAILHKNVILPKFLQSNLSYGFA